MGDFLDGDNDGVFFRERGVWLSDPTSRERVALELYISSKVAHTENNRIIRKSPAVLEAEFL